MTTTKLTVEQVQNELSQYTGTKQYYKVCMTRDLVITDGVKAFCDLCECFWAITDFIAFGLYPIAKNRDDRFSVVEIQATKSHSIKFRAFHDTDMPIYWQAHQKDYSKTIPTGTYKFYLIDNVLLLPSEY